MDDSQAWYYARGDVQTGPVSYEQLGEAVRAGRCGPGDLVWREGMSDWQRAAAVVGELFIDAAPPESSWPEPPAMPPGPGDPAGSAEPPQPYPPPPPAPAAEQPPYVPPAPHPQPGMAPLPYANPMSYGEQSYQGMAIGGFVCSLVALPMMCCVSFFSLPLSVTGLILGLVA
jgi:hypothetical protein